MNLLVFTLNNLLDAVFFFPAGKKQLQFYKKAWVLIQREVLHTVRLPLQTDVASSLVKRIRLWAGFCSQYYDWT